MGRIARRLRDGGTQWWREGLIRRPCPAFDRLMVDLPAVARSDAPRFPTGRRRLGRRCYRRRAGRKRDCRGRRRCPGTNVKHRMITSDASAASGLCSASSCRPRDDVSLLTFLQQYQVILFVSVARADVTIVFYYSSTQFTLLENVRFYGDFLLQDFNEHSDFCIRRRKTYCLQCFDTVGWVSGRSSSL